MRYNEEIHPDLVYRLSILGLPIKEIAEAIGITVDTLSGWRKKYESLEAAIFSGGVLADADVAVKLRERAIGYTHVETKVFMYKGRIVKTQVKKHYPPDTAAAQLWLNNRRAAQWSRNPTDEDTAPPVAINFNVVDATKKKRKNK